jgi:exopolysaccharide biosynthesis polyprenyl glycosylphosphotransferase
MIKHFNLRYSLYLLLLDVVLVVLMLLLSVWLRIVLPFGLAGTAEQRWIPLPVYAIALVVFNVAFSMMNVHAPRQLVTLLRELQVLTAAVLVGWLMLLGALYMTFRDVSRLQMGYALGVHLLLVYGTRLVLRFGMLSRDGRRGYNRNVLIVGTDALAEQMLTLVQAHQASGLHPLGLVALDVQDANRRGVVGHVDNIESLVLDCDAQEVVIAIGRDAPFDLPGFVRRLQTLPVNIRLIPQYSDLAFLQVNIEDFSGMPLLTLKEPVLTPYQRLTKRLFDLTMTLLLLVPALPVMAVIAVWIRLDSRGDVLFRQARVGEGGNPFYMHKFRSMVVGAEWQQEIVKQYDAHGNPIYKRPDDPRITRVGRVLRITSLDELPQLFDVLRGKMSLVGPRPELPELVDSYQAWQRKRFEVPQGITGWWQINGRANKPMHLATEDDLFYIRNYSLGLDLLILWRTVWTVLSRRGAF